MHAHAIDQRTPQAFQRLILAHLVGRACGNYASPDLAHDPAILDDQRFARKHAPDTAHGGLAPGGELKLQKLPAPPRAKLRRHQAGGDQRLRLGGEREARPRLHVVERLDAEGIARQHQASRTAVRAEVAYAIAYMPRKPFAKSGPHCL